MSRDEDFARRLGRAMIDAQTAHDRSVTSGEERGSKGQLGLEELSRTLAEQYALQAKKGTARLKERIPYLNREKVDRLEEADLQTPLTIQELVIIDLLLRESGQDGLAALLRPKNWVDAVVVTGNVLFVVGSQIHNYFGRDGDFVVAYDLRAVTHFLRDFDRRAAVPIEPDILYASSQLADAGQLSFGRSVPAAPVPTVLVGSPVTNTITEVACAELLGFDPWTPAPAETPTWFGWPGPTETRSTFTNPPRAASLDGSKRLFCFGGTEHVVDRDTGPTHGVVIIGQLDRPIVVAMGITAAATYACSMVASSINEEFPPRGEAIIAHVQAHSDLDPTRPGADKRIVRDANVVAVRRWSAEKRGWVEDG